MRLRRDNPMNRALAMILSFEVLVFLLAFPGMVLVDHVSTWVAGVAVGAAAVLALVAARALRLPWGHALGWLVQVAAVALGLLTSMMYAVGIIFAVIWATSMVLGRRIEQRQDQAGTPAS